MLMPLNILTTPITPKHLYSLARANILSPNALEYALRRIGTIYGELRVSSGESVLVGLRDAKFQPL